MNNTTQSSSWRRRLLLLTACASLVGGTSLVIAESKNETKPAVAVKIDPAPLQRSNDSLSFSPVVKKVGPSVVKVVTRERAKEIEMGGFPLNDPRLREFFGPFGMPEPGPNGPGRPGQQRRLQRQPIQMGLGSGVIVSDDGYILTNNHVVSGAETVKVTLTDGREFTAKVVGSDEKTDIAVIKVDAKDLPAVTFAKSDDVQVGDRVLAVGNPLGVGQTVTSGIVSGTGRSISIGVEYADFIQTDAAINPGNSGGALVDMQGRLIGINTAILSQSGGSQGIGFAVPSELAHSVLNSLVRDGKVVRGFLGVTIQDLTPALAESFKLKADSGAVVSDVSPESPAETAGIKSGDVVLQIAGKPIKDSHALKFTVAELQPGSETDVKVLREGKEHTFKVKIGEQPGEKRLAKTGDNAKDEGVLDGVGVSDLSPAARQEFEIPANVKGALVTEVEPNSPAAEAGLSAGDVIQEINRKPVRSGDDAVRLTEKTETKKTLLKLWSRGGTHYLVVDESGTPNPLG